MKWPPWHGLGSWGQERPPRRWVQGERSLPRVIERRYVLLALDGLNARQSHGLGDATGARSGPLAKMVLYYKTHLASVDECSRASLQLFRATRPKQLPCANLGGGPQERIGCPK